MMAEEHPETISSTQAPAKRDKVWARIIPLIILIVITTAVFWPVLGHEFLAYDDSVVVYKNPYLQVRSLVESPI